MSWYFPPQLNSGFPLAGNNTADASGQQTITLQDGLAAIRVASADDVYTHFPHGVAGYFVAIDCPQFSCAGTDVYRARTPAPDNAGNIPYGTYTEITDTLAGDPPNQDPTAHTNAGLTYAAYLYQLHQHYYTFGAGFQITLPNVARYVSPDVVLTGVDFQGFPIRQSDNYPGDASIPGPRGALYANFGNTGVGPGQPGIVIGQYLAGWEGYCQGLSNDPQGRAVFESANGRGYANAGFSRLIGLDQGPFPYEGNRGEIPFSVPPADPQTQPPILLKDTDGNTWGQVNADETMFWPTKTTSAGVRIVGPLLFSDATQKDTGGHNPSSYDGTDFTNVKFVAAQRHTYWFDEHPSTQDEYDHPANYPPYNPSGPPYVRTSSHILGYEHQTVAPARLFFIYLKDSVKRGDGGGGGGGGGKGKNDGAGVDMLATRTGLYIAQGAKVLRAPTPFQPGFVSTTADDAKDCGSPQLLEQDIDEAIILLYRRGTGKKQDTTKPPSDTNKDDPYFWLRRATYDLGATWVKDLDDDENEKHVKDGIKWVRMLLNKNRARETCVFYNDATGKSVPTDGSSTTPQPDGTGLLVVDIFDVTGKFVGTFPADGKGIIGKPADDAAFGPVCVSDKNQDMRVAFLSGGHPVYAVSVDEGRTWKDISSQLSS